MRRSKLGHHFGGWVPDLPHHKLLRLAPPLPVDSLPAMVDLRPQMPPVYDQGQLGSCTANSLAAGFQFAQIKQGLPSFIPSRLMIYFNERALEGDVSQDNGASLGDGISSLENMGVCPETEWAYDINQFDVEPSMQCFTDALKNKLTSGISLPEDMGQLKASLASGFPFSLGISVYSSFESDQVSRTGLVPLPGTREECIGGHAVLASGYDDSKSCFIVRNSWGSGWGLDGYFYLPYAYLFGMNLGSDYWAQKSVS